MPKSTEEFVGLMRRERHRLGWSAQDLADRCAERLPGLSRAVVANLESGRRAYITLDEATQIMNLLISARNERIREWQEEARG